MQESQIVRVPVPHGCWLPVEVASHVRLVEQQGGVDVYEVRVMPASVKHRRKRRHVDKSDPTAIE